MPVVMAGMTEFEEFEVADGQGRALSVPGLGARRGYAPSHVPWQPPEDATRTSSPMGAKNKRRPISEWDAERLSE
jgi:hypothetical protein